MAHMRSYCAQSCSAFPPPWQLLIGARLQPAAAGWPQAPSAGKQNRMLHLVAGCITALGQSSCVSCVFCMQLLWCKRYH